MRVYVQPSRSKNAIVTYHDIGTNHLSFTGFFSYPEMRVITRHFTVYHICAPGHHEGADAIAARALEFKYVSEAICRLTHQPGSDLENAVPSGNYDSPALFLDESFPFPFRFH
ncbi:unnamed protein product [Dibothriocephalus latus]|uniref:Uncharacterized protein n=1 Tax=Dibothriocephalus latus TaxID=60516 RepID=A0A3P7P5I9_DIBLA|nr:unnamed protein product [Dibothriocephalus latus]